MLNLKSSPLWDEFYSSFEESCGCESFFPIKIKRHAIDGFSTKYGRIKVTFNIAGFDKEQIKITYRNGYIGVMAKRDGGDRFIEYSKTLYSGDLKEDTITAKLKNGILTIEAEQIGTVEGKEIKIT